MIGNLIQNYGDVGALGVFVLVMAWYLRYQTQRQSAREDKHDNERIEKENKREGERKEEILFIRNLVVNDLKELHQDSLKNADLNKESIILQKSIAGQTIAALNLVCDKLNGKNSLMVEAKKKLKGEVVDKQC